MTENSPKILEQSSAMSVSIYIRLFPIMLGITTIPESTSPTLALELPSPSSNTRQFLARGNSDSVGNMPAIMDTNWECKDGSTSICVDVAMPITPRGNSEGRNRLSVALEAGGGCLTKRSNNDPFARGLGINRAWGYFNTIAIWTSLKMRTSVFPRVCWHVAQSNFA